MKCLNYPEIYRTNIVNMTKEVGFFFSESLHHLAGQSCYLALSSNLLGPDYFVISGNNKCDGVTYFLICVSGVLCPIQL